LAAAFTCRIDAFDRDAAASVIGALTSSVALAGFASLRTSQVRAWGEQLSLIDRVLRELLALRPSAREWTIALEYSIPRRQKTPDLVVLADDLIFVIEFKIGADRFDESSRWQAQSYALDLRDFHRESHRRVIVPILVASNADACANPELNRGTGCPVQCHNAVTLPRAIDTAYERLHDSAREPINPAAWLESPYRPTLTIIEAAEQLYSQHTVREISHAYADNLSGTTDCLVTAIEMAQRESRRIICFVTGVPGAGKTLAGLDAVHDPTLRHRGRPAGVFLSGNGPLVKIVSAALARPNHGTGESKRERERRVRTFIQNVHTFLKEHMRDVSRVPPEHVVIFDEAQRAWNAAKMMRKSDVAHSEAELVLDIVGRCDNWSVVIALVGGGQEIHDGEAGLAAWGDAICRSQIDWDVWASPEAIDGGSSVAGSRLFADTMQRSESVRRDSRLHLSVSVRSHRAQQIAEWVNHVVNGNAELAAASAAQFGEFPIALTRDLQSARNWLRDHVGEDRRAGLVASSGALRLRPFGLELSPGFRREFPYEHWFLAPSNDPRASSSLEVAASEFEIQGLELDWTGVCWGNDFWFDANSRELRFQRFSGSKWLRVRSESDRQFIANKYRVLLTRAREGMIIWVPSGVERDTTLPPEQFDGTAEFLTEAGLRTI